MIGILAIVLFLAAVVVHGGAVSVHSGWIDWQGLMLLGFLCLSLSGFSPPAVLARWTKRD